MHTYSWVELPSTFEQFNSTYTCDFAQQLLKWGMVVMSILRRTNTEFKVKCFWLMDDKLKTGGNRGGPRKPLKHHCTNFLSPPLKTIELWEKTLPVPLPFCRGQIGGNPFHPLPIYYFLPPECPRSLVKGSPRPPPLLRGWGQGRGPLLSMSPSVLSTLDYVYWYLERKSNFQ